MEETKLELRIAFIASVFLALASVYAVQLVFRIEAQVNNFLGIVPVLTLLSLVSLVAFVGVELTYLAAGTPNTHQRNTILILWGVEAVKSIIIAALPTFLVVYMTSVEEIKDPLFLSILTARFWWKDREQRFEFEQHETEVYFKSNVLKEAREVIEAQNFKGTKGDILHGAYIVEPRYEERLPCLLLGTPGSGKTLYLLAYILTPILRKIANNSRCRAFVQDVKNELIPVLESTGTPYVITNPADVRASRLELDLEVTDFEMCREMATVLVSISGATKSDGNHWDRNAVKLIANVMYGLVLKKRQDPDFGWQLRDILLIIEERKLLCEFLDQFQETKGIMDVYGKRRSREFELSNSGRDVFQTVDGLLEKLKALAGWWYECDRGFTVKEWAESNAVLHAGFSFTYPSLSKVVSQMVLSLAYQHLMRKTEEEGSREYSYFMFEEGAMLVPLPYHEEMLKGGRSKGLILYLVLQSRKDFIAAHVKAGVPKEVAEGILEFYSQRKAVFRLSEEDAHYVSENQVDKRIVLEETFDHNGFIRKQAKLGISLEPHALVNNPKPSPQNGLQGYFFVGGSELEQGWHYCHREWDDLQRSMPSASANQDGYKERDKVELRPLSEEERARLLP